MKVKRVQMRSSPVGGDVEAPTQRQARKLGSFTLKSADSSGKNEIIEIIRDLSNNDGLEGHRKTILKEFLGSVYGIDGATSSKIADSLNNILLDAAESGTDSNLVAALEARNQFLSAAKAKEEALFGVAASPSAEDWAQRPPTKAALEYRNRPDKSQKASEFLELHYGPWLRGNGLYRPDLLKFDKGLMQGLINEFRGRFDELAKLVPTKHSEVDARLGPDAANMTAAERKRALDSLRMRLD